MLDTQHLDLAAVFVQIRADRGQGGRGSRGVVHPHAVGLQQPGHRRVRPPQRLGVTDDVGEASHREPVQRVDPVEQLEDGALDVRIETLDLAKQLLEPVQQRAEAGELAVGGRVRGSSVSYVAINHRWGGP